MFQKILIANRGEIAVRIQRACRELGIRTVAIYSEADRDALHVRLADDAYCVGPPPSGQSYLNIPNIMSTATIAGVDAIHPGYGYLSERADFAEICQTHGIAFIGPRPETMEYMGDKATAKRLMAEAGVPVIPGSEGAVKDDAEAIKVAESVGYPVMVKAAAGGGGMGMRVAASQAELVRSLSLARSEGEAAFGRPEVYIEKLIVEPRHIEIQVFGDQHGNLIHLGERECSIQRRHQKVLEESPSPAVNEALRQTMGEAAVKGARAVGYTNAGTMEFLMDAGGNFYFIEMNTRIQVEHAVTELVTGTDLVREQILVAAGEPLSRQQEDITISGHAIECRLNAEDPNRDFAPSPGRIEFLHFPGGPGIRVDSGVYAGASVPPYYDSMFAKLVCYGDTRERCIRRLHAALTDVRVEGIKTNTTLHLDMLENEEFQAGTYSTEFIRRLFSAAD